MCLNVFGCVWFGDEDEMMLVAKCRKYASDPTNATVYMYICVYMHI